MSDDKDIGAQSWQYRFALVKICRNGKGKKRVLSSFFPVPVFSRSFPRTSLVTSVGRTLPECSNATVRLQSLRRSIFCRLFWMSRRILGTCKFPPADFTTNTVPSDRQTGWKRITQYAGLHARSPQQAKTNSASEMCLNGNGRFNGRGTAVAPVPVAASAGSRCSCR